MAEIFPFAAYRYSASRVKLEDVLTQPYDKITPEMQERYAARSPYNLIPVEKGKSLPGDSPENNVYTRAASKLEEWIAAGIVVRDPAPSLYAYFQEYAVPGTAARRERKGFIALGRVEDYEAGIVHRHERTLAGPRADRLELLRHTRTHTGQLMMLYPDPARRIDALLEQVSRVPAPVEVRDEYGVRHRLWPIVEPEIQQRIVAEMAGKKLIIADGHHRYETALAYRDECRAREGGANPAAPHEKVMMTFFNSRAEGLTILPTHRVVAGLAGFEFAAFRQRLATIFDWYAYPFTDDRAGVLENFRHDLLARGRERRAIGLYAGGGAFYLFLLRRDADLEEILPEAAPLERQLDVVLLHRVLLERGLGITAEAVAREAHITYVRELDAALAAVDTGAAQLACLLNPVDVDTVCEIALGGGVLPQKSTDFYPKLLSGLAMYRLEE
jgi:uncharacterized protein (DUF1015 family)